MVLQTNSYVVPKERRSEHTRLVRRFRQVLLPLGCDQFEVYEQDGTNWTSDQSSGRFVQIMRFRDRKHQLAIQPASGMTRQPRQSLPSSASSSIFPINSSRGYLRLAITRASWVEENY